MSRVRTFNWRRKGSPAVQYGSPPPPAAEPVEEKSPVHTAMSPAGTPAKTTSHRVRRSAPNRNLRLYNATRTLTDSNGLDRVSLRRQNAQLQLAVKQLQDELDRREKELAEVEKEADLQEVALTELESLNAKGKTINAQLREQNRDLKHTQGRLEDTITHLRQAAREHSNEMRAYEALKTEHQTLKAHNWDLQQFKDQLVSDTQAITGDLSSTVTDQAKEIDRLNALLAAATQQIHTLTTQARSATDRVRQLEMERDAEFFRYREKVQSELAAQRAEAASRLATLDADKAAAVAEATDKLARQIARLRRERDELVVTLREVRRQDEQRIAELELRLQAQRETFESKARANPTSLVHWELRERNLKERIEQLEHEKSVVEKQANILRAKWKVEVTAMRRVKDRELQHHRQQSIDQHGSISAEMKELDNKYQALLDEQRRARRRETAQLAAARARLREKSVEAATVRNDMQVFQQGVVRGLGGVGEITARLLRLEHRVNDLVSGLMGSEAAGEGQDVREKAPVPPEADSAPHRWTEYFGELHDFTNGLLMRVEGHCDRLSREAKQIHSSVGSAQSSVQALERENAALRSKNDALVNSGARLYDMKRALEECQAERDALKARVGSISQANAQLEKEITELMSSFSRERSSHMEQLKVTGDQVDHLMTQVSELTGANQSLGEEIAGAAGLRERCAQLEQKLHTVEAAHSKASDECAYLRQSKQSLYVTIERLGAKVSALQAKPE